MVQFNVRTGTAQGAIDVVGLQLNDNRVAEVQLCEPSTHTSGLGGYEGGAAGKGLKKITSVDMDFTRHRLLWTTRRTARAATDRSAAADGTAR